MRLLFISNLFPTAAEPYRGLDNATLLHELGKDWEIRAISPRPVLPWERADFAPRECDATLRPRYVRAAYLPKIGGAVNDGLMAGSLRAAFEEALREFRPDAVLSSWLYPDSCAVARLAAGRVPLVAIAQGSDVHQYLQMPARKRAMLRWLPRAAGVVTRSAELGRLLAGAGFPAGKLHTVYNGVDLEMFRPGDRAEARREAGVAEDACTVLFVGNFYAVKQPLLLVRAFAALCRAEPRARLVTIGGGPLEAETRALAEQLGCADRVTFAGRRGAAEVARWMRAADVLCLPSRNEGVPNVILEAFASGLPVVASRVGGIPEVLDSAELGELTPEGDEAALALALEAQLRGPRNTEAIRGHGEKFSWLAAAMRYDEILRRAAA